MPFLMASCCGWGFMPLTLLMHACLSSWEGDALRVLWTNLIKITLFNLFGMLGAYEQITQMRNNYWHAALLGEALQLQKLVRARMHRLTSNTLPKAILRAIGRNELDFVKVFPQCTVLQADMVGFTALSATYPPQKVSHTRPACNRAHTSHAAARTPAMQPHARAPRCWVSCRTSSRSSTGCARRTTSTRSRPLATPTSCAPARSTSCAPTTRRAWCAWGWRCRRNLHPS